MIYKGKKSISTHVIAVLVFVLPIGIYFLDKDTFRRNPFILLPLLSPAILVLWGYFNTVYTIDNNKLTYRSSFLKGKIEIAKITEVVKGKTLWSGIKPALAGNGLIIKYNTYDEVYIAPKDNATFLFDLLKVNPNIKITETKKHRN